MPPGTREEEQVAPTGFGEDTDGEVSVTTELGSVYKIVAKQATAPNGAEAAARSAAGRMNVSRASLNVASTLTLRLSNRPTGKWGPGATCAGPRVVSG